jgi:3-deoxy-D-manno-octulosonate 8-phosphate phosphatase (KDO 8-P phosphatase)
MDAELGARARRVRILLLDVDGVLTDGTTLVRGDGTETLRFDIRDGLGLVAAQTAGLIVGVISARASAPVALRAAHLGLRHVLLGVADKLDAVRGVLEHEGLPFDALAYMGDDLVDLAVLARAGLSLAPCDAMPDVRSRVHVVTEAPGGHGAVRQAVELVLKAQDRWDGVLAGYLQSGR